MPDVLQISLDRAYLGFQHIGWRVRGPLSGTFIGLKNLPNGAVLRYEPEASDSLEMPTIEVDTASVTSIAEDLRTPPPGAVEGAEIVARPDVATATEIFFGGKAVGSMALAGLRCSMIELRAAAVSGAKRDLLADLIAELDDTVKRFKL